MDAKKSLGSTLGRNSPVSAPFFKMEPTTSWINLRAGITILDWLLIWEDFFKPWSRFSVASSVYQYVNQRCPKQALLSPQLERATHIPPSHIISAPLSESHFLWLHCKARFYHENSDALVVCWHPLCWRLRWGSRQHSRYLQIQSLPQLIFDR